MTENKAKYYICKTMRNYMSKQAQLELVTIKYNKNFAKHTSRFNNSCKYALERVSVTAYGRPYGSIYALREIPVCSTWFPALSPVSLRVRVSWPQVSLTINIDINLNVCASDFAQCMQMHFFIVVCLLSGFFCVMSFMVYGLAPPIRPYTLSSFSSAFVISVDSEETAKSIGLFQASELSLMWLQSGGELNFLQIQYINIYTHIYMHKVHIYTCIMYKCVYAFIAWRLWLLWRRTVGY